MQKSKILNYSLKIFTFTKGFILINPLVFFLDSFSAVSNVCPTDRRLSVSEIRHWPYTDCYINKTWSWEPAALTEWRHSHSCRVPETLESLSAGEEIWNKAPGATGGHWSWMGMLPNMRLAGRFFPHVYSYSNILLAIMLNRLFHCPPDHRLQTGQADFWSECFFSVQEMRSWYAVYFG